MKFRHILLLSLTLISASAQKPTPLSFTTKITPEMIETLEAQGGQALKINPSRAPRPPKAPLTPEQQRTKMLQGLKIDRTTSGILANRLAEKNEGGKTTTIIPTPPKDPEAKSSANPQIKKQREDMAKLATFKNDFNQFTRDITLGRWIKVKDYLASLPSGDATLAFRQMVTQLNTPVTVRPRKELTSLGAKQHQQQQYLRPEEFLALTDASQKAPDNSVLPQLASLIKGERKPPRDFFVILAKGTRYFGLSDEETRARTARLLIEAGHLDETITFLPSLKVAKEKKNHAALNLLGRYYAESYSADRDGEHLENAWQISLGIISQKKAPLNERAEALYRALALVPDLEDGTGSDWLTETFSNASNEGFEILATVGTMTSQVREHRSPDFRLEQLKLQTSAVAALTSNEEIDLKPWQEILTLYVRNWNPSAPTNSTPQTRCARRPKSMPMEIFSTPATSHRFSKAVPAPSQLFLPATYYAPAPASNGSRRSIPQYGSKTLFSPLSSSSK